MVNVEDRGEVRILGVGESSEFETRQITKIRLSDGYKACVKLIANVPKPRAMRKKNSDRKKKR